MKHNLRIRPTVIGKCIVAVIPDLLSNAIKTHGVIFLLFISGYSFTADDLIGSWNVGYADTMSYCTYRKAGNTIINEICRDSVLPQQSQSIGEVSFFAGDSAVATSARTSAVTICTYAYKNDTLYLYNNGQIASVFFQKNEKLTSRGTLSTCSSASNPQDTVDCSSLQQTIILTKKQALIMSFSTRLKQEKRNQFNDVRFMANGRKVASSAAICYGKDCKSGRFFLSRHVK